jgi:hypothetical protein
VGKGWVKPDFFGSSSPAVGEWFSVPEPQLQRSDGRGAFAKKTTPDPRRPAVLAIAIGGPAATLWPRSGRDKGDGITHHPHPLGGDHPDQCMVRVPGRICSHVPCTVRVDRLRDWYRCGEPEGSPLWSALYAEPAP